MADRVIVEVDPDLSDLIPGFLTRKRTDVAMILGAIARRDHAEVGRIAHRLTGEGGSYGFTLMTETGRLLEQAAAAGDDSQLTMLAHQLLDYIDRLEIVVLPSSD
jgi:HPt (histidine-containing phosphotransfer) domain-containing protein